MNWAPLNNAIDSNSSFLISGHMNLDGDCVGSQLAFLWYLRSLGKKAVCYCADPLPRKLAFLKDSEFITQNKPNEKFDVLMILDCSNIKRIGWDVREVDVKSIINIDHHRDNANFGALNFVDPTAAATGIIIFEFFREYGIRFPLHVAETLYTAIMDDTGGFRFSNTSGRPLRICAELADMGVNCSGLHEKLYESHSLQSLILRSRIWSSLKFHLNGRVCSMDMPMSLLDEVGAVYSDSEGMADNTITAAGVEVGVMTKHTPEETHVSLRSTGRIDVGKIAQKIHGGGGHNCAAGCTIKLPYKEAMEQVLEILKKELSEGNL